MGQIGVRSWLELLVIWFPIWTKYITIGRNQSNLISEKNGQVGICVNRIKTIKVTMTQCGNFWRAKEPMQGHGRSDCKGYMPICCLVRVNELIYWTGNYHGKKAFTNTNHIKLIKIGIEYFATYFRKALTVNIINTVTK